MSNSNISGSRPAALTAEEREEVRRKIRETTRQFDGRTVNTENGDGPAIRLFNIYRKMRDMCPLDEITHEEIREDFLQSMMVEFMGFLSTTAIPFNCDDELMPRNRPAEGESVRVVIASTLSKYVGRIIRCIWRLFPSHPDFAELDINKQTDVPDWWKRVRPGFEKTIDDFHRHMDSTYTFGAYAVRPLFLKNRYNPRAGQPIAEPIADFVSEIDLHSICKGLMKKASVNIGQGEIGPLQQRAWLVWLYHCLDRPSEIKFIDIRSWMHIPALGTVNAPTTDKKTKKKYSCGLVPDKHDFFCDILHVTAALFAVEEGAYRTAAQKSTESFLFQPFHGKSDNNVAKQITAVIRENLPAGTPTRIRNELSCRSVRYAGVTTVLANLTMPSRFGSYRSGHAGTGSTMDSYTDLKNVILSLPGGRVLARWNDYKREVVLPSLLFVSDQEMVHKFIEQLFLMSIPAMRRGGDKYGVTYALASSFVMYHNMVTDLLGMDDACSTKARDVARRVGLADPRWSGLAPEEVLKKWSQEALQNFRNENVELARAGSRMNEFSDAINSQVCNVRLTVSAKSDSFSSGNEDCRNIDGNPSLSPGMEGAT